MTTMEREDGSPQGLVPVKRGRGRRPNVQLGVPPGAMPLDYMLAVIRDPNAGTARRDKLAIAAAPYCHPRVAEATRGKKDLQADAAAMAGTDTAWAGDLEFEGRAN